MVVDAKSILHRRRINFCAYSGSVNQPLAGCYGEAISRVLDLLGRLSADRTLATGDQDTQTAAGRLCRLLDCPAGDRRHAATVPVEAEHAAERLEPPRVR
jgi:hypothetical protein